MLFLNTKLKKIFKHTFSKCCFILFLNLVSLNNIAFSQKDETFDEIEVILNVQRVGNIEISIVIKDQNAYNSLFWRSISRVLESVYPTNGADTILIFKKV